ncbi:MAG: hypothetical protein PUD34_00230 [bacterium]|nr:hypothetical protein [bacterium]
MKNFIEYYYNILITDYVAQENYFYLESKDEIYYFCRVRKTEEELKKIYDVIENSKYHLLIKSKYNTFVVQYNNLDYVLLKVRSLLNDTINFDEIINNRVYVSNIDPINWGRVWQQKIDYLEEQMREFKIGKYSFYQSFIYFVGLGENAISYLNYNSFKSNNFSLCHYRVYYPNKPVNYFNSLNVIVDYDMRDYAEYIKSVFFNNDDFDALNLVRILLQNKKYSRDDFGFFYARMLYPSYFFDCFSNNILDDKLKEDDLVKIIDKIDKYEFFLKDIYYEIKKVYDIPAIDWILKKSNKL